ncbi:MAG: hypothetical protein Fur006_50980 [Coleofasciculaceae cyanobacterium]
MFGKKLDEKAKQVFFDTSSAIGSKLQGRDGNPNVLGTGELVSLESVYTTRCICVNN